MATGLPAPVRGPSQTAAVEVFGLDDDIVGYRRSPSDVVRLILFSLATVALLVLTRWAEGTVLAIQSDVVALFGRLDSSVEHTLNQTLAIAAGIMSAAVYVPPLFRSEGTVLAIQSDVVALFGRLDSSVEHTLNQTLAIAAGIMSAAVYLPPLL